MTVRAAAPGLAPSEREEQLVREIRVESWAELHERLFEDSWQEAWTDTARTSRTADEPSRTKVSRRASSVSAETQAHSRPR